VTAIIVPANRSDPPSLAKLRSELRDALPRYAVPRALLCVGEIPMLASGKPDRLKLRMIADEHYVSDAAGGASTEG